MCSYKFSPNEPSHNNKLLLPDIDECEDDEDTTVEKEENFDFCHDFAECIDTQGSYRCVCESGFEGDGFNCTGSLSLSLFSLGVTLRNSPIEMNLFLYFLKLNLFRLVHSLLTIDKVARWFVWESKTTVCKC